MKNLKKKVRAQTQTELQVQMEETKKRKQEEQQVDEETPAKIAATETDSESEDFLSNTVNSEISSGEEDPMDHQTTLPLTPREQTAPRSANSSTNTSTPKIASKSTPHIDKKKHAYTAKNNTNPTLTSSTQSKAILTKTQSKEIPKVTQNVQGTKPTNRLKNPLQRPNFRT